ncbi:MAG: TolC family protein [Deltaproteobacteria bacterium]|nr:MAG: TolC family protein [Deltaproteobacteria bacterium]
MMFFFRFWVLLLLGALLQGCYRPVQMNMASYTRPYLQSSPANSNTENKVSIPKVQRLTPKTVVFHVLHHNATLRWLRQSQKVALANVNTLSPVENPELRVMGLSGALASGNVSKLGVRLRWNPPFPSVYAAKQDQARAEARIQEQRLWAKTYQLLAEAQKLYYTLQALHARVQVQQQSLLRALQAWKWEQKRQSLERTTVLRVAARKLDVLRKENELQSLREQHQQSKARLMQLMGVQGLCRLSKERFPPPNQLLGLQVSSWVTRAIQRSPTLGTLRSMYRMEHAKLWVEKTKRIPWLSFIQMSYEFNESPWPNGFEFGFGIHLPVFSWNSGGIHKQNVQIRAIQTQTRVQVAYTVLTVRRVHKQWSRLVSTVNVHQQVVLKHMQGIQAQLVKLKKQPGTTLEQFLQLEEDMSRLKLQRIAQTLQLQHAQVDLLHHTYTPIWKMFRIQIPKS